jgi:hypothetical protein
VLSLNQFWSSNQVDHNTCFPIYVQSVDVAPLVPELANFFDGILNRSALELNLKVCLTLHLLVWN